MKKGEIWEAFLDPTIGSEPQPAVVISGNLANKHLNTVIVCPLTSKLKNYHGNLIVDPNVRNGLRRKSEVVSVHVRSISKKMFKSKLGDFDTSEMEVIIENLEKIIKY